MTSGQNFDLNILSSLIADRWPSAFICDEEGTLYKCYRDEFNIFLQQPEAGENISKQIIDPYKEKIDELIHFSSGEGIEAVDVYQNSQRSFHIIQSQRMHFERQTFYWITVSLASQSIIHPRHQEDLLKRFMMDSWILFFQRGNAAGFSQEFIVQDFNESARRLFKMDEASQGQAFSQLFRPFPERWKQCLLNASQSGKAIVFQDFFDPLNLFLDVVIYPVGKHQIALLVRDVSGSRLQETVNRRLESMLEHAKEAIIGITQESFIFSWNRGAEELFHYKAAEVIGKHINLIVPPDRLHETAIFKDYIDKRQTVKDFETQRLDKKRKERFVSLNLSPIYDARKELLGSTLFFRDIEKRKNIEEQLFNSFTMLERILDLSPLGIIMLNLKGEVMFCNTRSGETFGASKDHMVGQSLLQGPWLWLDENELPLSQDNHPVMVAGDKHRVLRFYKVQIKMASGETKPLHIHTTPVLDKNNKLTNILLIHHHSAIHEGDNANVFYQNE